MARLEGRRTLCPGFGTHAARELHSCVASGRSTGLTWLLTDHLGSTVRAVDALTGVSQEMKYTPWGATRSGALPTTFRYTGQRAEPGLDGIYFYGARWYDPALGRFLAADTYVPESQGVQAWDRYAFVNNNPVNLTDPTGHYACGDGIDDPRCDEYEPVTTFTIEEEENDIDLATGAVLVLDGGSAVISGVEAVFSDVVGGAIFAVGCGGAGPGTYGLSCGISAELALAVDVYVASPAGLSSVENAMGVTSTAITYWNDKDDAWGFDENGKINYISVGRDTVVSARNTIAGVLPESNVDAFVSFSQFKYDLDRLSGVKAGGPIVLMDSSGWRQDGINNLFRQFFVGDWWR